MEKYITFSVPIKKKCDDNKIMTHTLRWILIVLGLLIFHYQILLITCLEEFLIV